MYVRVRREKVAVLIIPLLSTDSVQIPSTRSIICFGAGRSPQATLLRFLTSITLDMISLRYILAR